MLSRPHTALINVVITATLYAANSGDLDTKKLVEKSYAKSTHANGEIIVD